MLPEEKKKILEKVSTLSKKEWNLKESPSELFEPFRKIILAEYKNDSFKRFIRTERCLELLEKYSTIKMYFYQRLDKYITLKMKILNVNIFPKMI